MSVSAWPNVVFLIKEPSVCVTERGQEQQEACAGLLNVHSTDSGTNERNYDGKCNGTLRSCADGNANSNVKQRHVGC